MPYVLFIGEMLIDFIPTTNDLNDSPCYQPHPGGAVANAAVALARLGGASRFVGKLSEDSFGRLLLDVLRENQVDTRFIPTTSQSHTTLALVTLQANGQRAFSFYRQQTADTLLEASELDEHAWDDVAIVHAGSVLLTVDPARSATLAALEQAQQRDITVSFDVNARPALWQTETELRTMLGQVIAYIDLLKCSAEEAHYLDPTRATPFEPTDTDGLVALGQHLLAQGPSLVLITLGELGALFITHQHTAMVAASTVQALDTTGAGDAFMGAILAQLLKYSWLTKTQLAALNAQQLQVLGTFANKAAGLSCTRYGGIASLPFLAEMEN